MSFSNQLSTLFHTPQSSDAIPLSEPWQWAAYGAGHGQNINSVWLAWATLLFISHFPNVRLWKEQAKPQTNEDILQQYFLKCSLHTSRALLSIPVDTRSWNTQGGEENHFLDIQSKEDYVHTHYQYIFISPNHSFQKNIPKSPTSLRTIK